MLDVNQTLQISNCIRLGLWINTTNEPVEIHVLALINIITIITIINIIYIARIQIIST